MERTARGVYIELDKSPYRMQVMGKVWVFSSAFRMSVFVNEISRIRDRFEKLNEKCGMPCDVSINLKGLELSYSKAQPKNQLILDVMPDG